MAGFLSPGSAPLYDIENSYNATEPHDILIRTPKLKQDLARSFLKSANVSVKPPVTTPDYNMVLVRRHGFTTGGTDIETAVFQAYFNLSNAQAQTTATLLRGAFDSLSASEAKAWTGEANNEGTGAFEPLTTREAYDC